MLLFEAPEIKIAEHVAQKNKTLEFDRPQHIERLARS
jgi:hypothetical protein